MYLTLKSSLEIVAFQIKLTKVNFGVYTRVHISTIRMKKINKIIFKDDTEIPLNIVVTRNVEMKCVRKTIRRGFIFKKPNFFSS